MVASFNPVENLESLMLEFEDAYAELIGSQACVYDANQALASVKSQLEVSRAEMLVEGVEGRNNEQREAHIRLALHELYQEQFLCEAELARVKLQAEVKRKAWDLLRYKLRAFEAQSQLKLPFGATTKNN